jgi:hypothetical protein
VKVKLSGSNDDGRRVSKVAGPDRKWASGQLGKWAPLMLCALGKKEDDDITSERFWQWSGVKWRGELEFRFMRHIAGTELT